MSTVDTKTKRLAAAGAKAAPGPSGEAVLTLIGELTKALSAKELLNKLTKGLAALFAGAQLLILTPEQAAGLKGDHLSTAELGSEILAKSEQSRFLKAGLNVVTVLRVAGINYQHGSALLFTSGKLLSAERSLLEQLFAQVGVLLDRLNLRQTEQNYAITWDTLPSGLIFLNASGVVERANQSVADLLGDDVNGRLFYHYIRDLGRREGVRFDTKLSRILETIQSGRQITFYAEVTDRGTRHLQIIASPLASAGEKATYVVTVRDVTSLLEKTLEAGQMAKLAARHSRELWELTQIAEVTSIFGFQLGSIYQKFLSKIESLMRSPHASIYVYQTNQHKLVQAAGSAGKGKHAREVGLDEAEPAAQAFVTKKAIMRNKLRDGGINMAAMPVSFHSKLLGVIVVSGREEPYREHDLRMLDLVAGRLAVLIENATLYHEVNSRRERWEAVFKFTDEGIVIFDSKGVIVGFNLASARLTGHTASEAIGQPFTKIVKVVAAHGTGPADLPVRRVLGDGQTITKFEQQIETRTGTRLWVEGSYSPILDNTGRVTSGIAILRDIQKDREVEEIKSDFISIVSHELRTPLSAIKGFLSMILKKDFGSLNEKQFHYLSRVYQSNQRMIDLVEDLLDVSYIESGKIVLNQNPIALENVITEVVTELASKAFEKQITLKVNRKHRLPLVLADEMRLRQILVNLVDNAIKYSFPQSEVIVDFKVQSDELVTSISDAGVGMAPSQLDRIFLKFGRLYNPMSVQAGGSGLGLYIVKRLVESHSGRIWVTSREAKGSKFSFSLPIAKQLPLLG